ncbi:hypothetical protein [Cryobacterium sp. GrIS_2_6]|uniref:hypothetical protein n=1 Tax=Cryobacterium sp. GrIS_2_6 TaxID=3162785 RepID=UPI002E02B89B|nr:hypothetical protein [Cryobacterium psychrotolerans]
MCFSILTILVTERDLDGEFEKTEHTFDRLAGLDDVTRSEHNHIESITEIVAPAPAEPGGRKRRFRVPGRPFPVLRMAASEVVALRMARVSRTLNFSTFNELVEIRETNG